MQNSNIDFILDYRTIVIENFKQSIKQFEWRKQLAAGNNQDLHVVKHLVECQTYFALLIQFGMSLDELNIMAERTKVEFLGKK